MINIANIYIHTVNRECSRLNNFMGTVMPSMVLHNQNEYAVAIDWPLGTSKDLNPH